MAKLRRERKPTGPIKTLTTFLYNILLAVAALVGFISYANGVTIEGALLRVAIVMLLGVLLAYTADFALWYLSARRPNVGGELPVAQLEIESHARHLDADAGQRVVVSATAGSNA